MESEIFDLLSEIDTKLYMVEGVHPSDLGMQQYADRYIKKIREILNEKTEKHKLG